MVSCVLTMHTCRDYEVETVKAEIVLSGKQWYRVFL